MTDAALSDAKEIIATSSKLDRAASDHACLSTEVNHHPRPDAIELVVAAAPTTTTVVVLSSPSDDVQLVEKCRKNSLPTAIVKPKYQRKSHDDRQLPPVVCIDREIPWYHNSTTTSITTTTNNNNQTHGFNNNPAARSGTPKKIQPLPHFERKHKKNLILLRESIPSALVSEKEKFNSLRLCEKDIDDSSSSVVTTSVAIVTPRKKDIMESASAAKHVHNPTVMKPVKSTYVNDGGGSTIAPSDEQIVLAENDEGFSNCSIQKNVANNNNNINNNSLKCSNNNNNNNKNDNNHQHEKVSSRPALTSSSATSSSIKAATPPPTSSINRKVLPERREKHSAGRTSRYRKDITSGESFYLNIIMRVNRVRMNEKSVVPNMLLYMGHFINTIPFRYFRSNQYLHLKISNSNLF